MVETSSTDLIKKLGIKPDYCITVINPPDSFEDRLSDLPESVRVENFLEEVEFDMIHFFTQDRAELEQQFEYLKNCLNPNGMLWISWPKQASKIESNLDENQIREVGLAGGLVDVKVCAIDNDWSGLKFVYRKKDR